MRATASPTPRPVPIHYLRPNAKVWSPPSLIFLDSETATALDGDTELLSLRCWAALGVDRKARAGRAGSREWATGTTPDELADWICARAKGRKTIWCYAHNLGFDLVTTALPVTLTARGWEITDFAVRSESPWMRLTNGRTVLTVCDSWSWLRDKLASSAAAGGARKWELPDDQADADTWLAYCRHDVEILADLMDELLEWWDREQLGRWTITGAACGWNAMRHRPMTERTVIDPGPDGIALDRKAIRGGRRDVARVGDLGAGPWVEIDFRSAHATVAATLPLPVRRGATFTSLPIDHPAVTGEGWGILAEVTVECDRPRYPMSWRGVTWYPVGRFSTVLAGPEIAWAAERGDLVAVGPGQFHKLGWALEGWGRWILELEAGQIDGTGPAVRALAKHWGRAVLGKYAARTQSTIPLGEAPTLGWGYHEARDHTLDRPAAFVDLAGRRYYAVYDTEGDNPYPAVYAWVESHTRARLGRLLDALPDGMWVQADTDGAILDMSSAAQLTQAGVKLTGRAKTPFGAAAALCDRLAPLTAPLVPRPKKEHRALEIMGAQHLVTDTERRLSGVRRDATRAAGGVWVQRDWPKLPAQLARDTPGVYARPVRRQTFAQPLAHRWILPDGHTLPPIAALDDAGANTLRPWAESWGRLVDVGGLGDQYEGLRGLY